ncbi:MAG: hypothetical protein HWD61_12810 [Parachlamydiaceae bacterium]|nr:MAG: hypothetical protein HWD61_12810 [Parachlamydiaceae bacterium]
MSQTENNVESTASILNEIQEGIKHAFSQAVDFPDKETIEFFSQLGLPLMIRSTGKEDTLKVANQEEMNHLLTCCRTANLLQK